MAKSSPTAPSFETGMLAYARSVQITEGLFHATRSDDPELRTPIAVLEKGVLGQSLDDKAKNPGKPNPQSVEFAVIPQGHDGVELSFSVRFMPLSLRPHGCGSTHVGETYQRLAAGYKAAGGYRVLAALYVWNIANARFAWRNRFQADEMSVTVRCDGITLRFDPFLFDLDRAADETEMAAALIEGDADDLAELIDLVTDGLSNGANKAVTLEVSWNAAMRPGQEIFPSQEYLRDEKKEKGLSRVYAKLPTRGADGLVQQASMHSQKIGAALRHIDVWHGSETHRAPIPVNPYGGVKETGAVLRDPKSKKGFYDLRAKAQPLLDAVENAADATEIPGEVHFLVANLVRGGVFASSNKAGEQNDG
ncbi:MAG: type I-F CRISPR-associated protein Csy3 [Myxococcales bacterium]|nr:type I-F CRISPR-associated protein Csy3 [Myxococcales bacterium]